LCLTAKIFANFAIRVRPTSDNISSMLQDISSGQRTEIDAVKGAIMREAGKLKALVPVNSVLTMLVKALEKSYDGRSA